MEWDNDSNESGWVPMIDTTLRWRLRRGMKELDVLFERYVTTHYAGASAAEREAFAKLATCEDPEIWEWTLGLRPVPAEFKNVIDSLRRHH